MMDIRKLWKYIRKIFKVIKIIFYIIIVPFAIWGLFNFIIDIVFKKIC
jgi:hypothetical protein